MPSESRKVTAADDGRRVEARASLASAEAGAERALRRSRVANGEAILRENARAFREAAFGDEKKQEREAK